jgi:hypothetical protein
MYAVLGNCSPIDKAREKPPPQNGAERLGATAAADPGRSADTGAQKRFSGPTTAQSVWPAALE